MTKDDAQFITQYFDEKFESLLENIDTKLKVELTPIKSDIAELKDDMKVVKAAVKATNKDLQLNEQRITALENAV